MIRPSYDVLNASTVKILNTIRANASAEYQSLVPVITKETQIPGVGDIICGNGILKNAFLNGLINRIAFTIIRSTTFNNPYVDLKKGYLETGETIEDIFINMVKAHQYSAEKAPSREFKRSIPDVKTAFYAKNWTVMYPMTIEEKQLRHAFSSTSGVTDFITQLIETLYKSYQYDEYLLFKYLIIKAVSSGVMYPVSIGTEKTAAAKAFRGISNKIVFPSRLYNQAGVQNDTPKSNQIIFMDSMFEAEFDVEILSASFHMEKAEFMGKRHIIDDFTTFDNERFEYIRAESDGLEEVTDDELALMADVKAIILDKEWFQIYDNLMEITNTEVASGLYRNYWLHSWKTVAHSPFANAIVFVSDSADTDLPATVTVEISGKESSEEAVVFTVMPDFENPAFEPRNVRFIQTEDATTDGIAIHPFGAVVIPAAKIAESTTLELEINGVHYTAASAITGSSVQGATITFNQD